MIWSWLKGSTEPAAKPEPACSFCRRDRMQVRHLVATDKVMICDDCIEASLEAIESHGGARDPLHVARDRVRTVLDRLPDPSPFATSRALIESWLTLSGGGAAACREAAQLALRARNTPAALACIQRIAPSERTPADALAEAMYHHYNGAFPRALAVLDSIDPKTLPPAERVRFTSRRILALFESGQVKPEQVPALLEQLEQARRDLSRLSDEEVGKEMRPWLLDLIEAGRAWCSLATGETADAELRTQARLSRFPNLPEALAFIVRILVVQGASDRAEFVRNETLAHAHPESWLAQSLSNRNAGPGGGPYR